MEDNDDLDFIAPDHNQLVSAVTKLDKTQHITAPTRNEPTNLSSEFNLVKRSNKLNLLNAVKILEDTAHHEQISKKLKATQNKSQVLPKPLEKPQAERIKRETGYSETKEKVSRWDAVVARSRTVDFVSFPLKTLETKEKLPPTNKFLSKLQLKSQLEKELDEVDPPMLAEEEDDEEKTFPMTYQEMLEHRQHLAKIRAQQSYKAAKAKRQSKIKSKKYHRVLKKERLKQQLKEFEELQTKDPEEALKKLEELEKRRALERHTLRHKNTGKWAKSKLVRAKYDKDVRQQLAEQLSVSRSLTHKTQDAESTDDDADDNEGIPDISLSQDPLNPWMMKRSDKSNIDQEFNFGYKKYLKDKMYKRKTDTDSESEAENTSDLPQSADKTESEKEVLEILKKSVNKLSNMEPDKPSAKKGAKKVSFSTEPRKKRKASKPIIATTSWVVDDVNDSQNEIKPTEDISVAFETFENDVSKQVEEKLQKLRNDINNLDTFSKDKVRKDKKRKAPKDNLEYLKLRNQKIKAIIDEELIETNKSTADEVQKDKDIVTKAKNLQSLPEDTEKTNTNTDIDPTRFIEVKPKYLNTALSKQTNDIDELDDDDEQVVPKVDIEEVFEDDDVVDSFRQEKEDEINKDKPEDISLSLPGWGSWGGKGVKAPKRKRNRFIGKPPPKMPRRDENKGDIIIMEVKDPKLTSHKVTEVPFPFNAVKDYEASIRAPLGNTFIPEGAHRKLIKPSVITRAGTIIEPMGEEELLMPRNKSFNNESVIKLLAKK